MSMRTLIEINHDYAFDITHGLIPALQRYVASGSKDDAEALSRFGVKVIGMRHHADKFIIDGRTDGFPAQFLAHSDHPGGG